MQLDTRGATRDEVIETIQQSSWKDAELGKLECRKDFTFNQIWNKRHYSTKQVRPIFADETDKIVVITVYVYYF